MKRIIASILVVCTLALLPFAFCGCSLGQSFVRLLMLSFAEGYYYDMPEGYFLHRESDDIITLRYYVNEYASHIIVDKKVDAFFRDGDIIYIRRLRTLDPDKEGELQYYVVTASDNSKEGPFNLEEFDAYCAEHGLRFSHDDWIQTSDITWSLPKDY